MAVSADVSVGPGPSREDRSEDDVDDEILPGGGSELPTLFVAQSLLLEKGSAFEIVGLLMSVDVQHDADLRHVELLCRVGVVVELVHVDAAAAEVEH